MSTFAQASFNASIYSSARPTYPGKLFKRILGYHKRSPGGAGFDLALDLGCGTGQATRHLMPFRRIIGIDTSETMLSTARTLFSSPPWSEKTSFANGSAEDLSSIGVQDGTVDLMISAQACHWFDWSKIWPETRRVLKKGGCAAFWIYSEIRLSAYPSLSEVLDPSSSLGPHFERPGRTILERHLLDVPHPSTILPSSSSSSSIADPTGCGLGDVERVFFAGLAPPEALNLPSTTRLPRRADLDATPVTKVEHNPIILTKSLTWLELLAYLRSWSALHNYLEQYPQDKEAPVDQRFLEEDTKALEGGEKWFDMAVELGAVKSGDIAIRFWKDLRQGVSNAGRKSGLLDEVDVEWPVAMILVRRT
ncbi:S-adenosyl-L-methionine-dependent methyltransferase, partial [Amanita rubescens]